MDKDRLLLLIEKMESGKANPAELAELDQFYDQFEDRPDLIDLNLGKDFTVYREFLFSGIQQRIKPSNTRIRWIFTFSAAAASILLLIGGFYFYNQYKGSHFKSAVNLSQVIQPGTKKATLTLASGEKILLDDNKKDTIYQNNNATTINGGQLKNLSTAQTGSTNRLVYNTLQTPKGGVFQLILQDGTKVWVNAATYIKYPLQFSGNERVVQVEGEAYFEVARDSKRPFIVQTPHQVIEVLGTTFNVNCYANEPVESVNLLKGAVRLHTNKLDPHFVKLEPGQQSILKDENYKVTQGNTATSIAWIGGNFEFYNTEIQTVLRQLARWYDFDIKYEGKVPSDLFTGGISMDADFNTVLKILEVSNIHCRIIQSGNDKILIINQITTK